MSEVTQTNTFRRRLLGAGGAMLAATAAVMPAEAARPRVTTPYAVKRNRFGITTDTYLPDVEILYRLPFDKQTFSDSEDVTLQDNNTFVVNATGLYRICLCVDWAAQHGVDMDLRYYGIVRKGTSPYVIRASRKDDFLAVQDVPGSDPPAISRFQCEWTPGLVPHGGFASIDVIMPGAGIVEVGDVAFASLTSISEENLGAGACNLLNVKARVVGKDKVRVLVCNPSLRDGINIASGTLRVMAMSCVKTRGESTDAWTVLQTPTEELNAGDIIYATFRSKTHGDYIQATKMTFIQFERWA